MILKNVNTSSLITYREWKEGNEEASGPLVQITCIVKEVYNHFDQHTNILMYSSYYIWMQSWSHKRVNPVVRQVGPPHKVCFPDRSWHGQRTRKKAGSGGVDSQ